MNLKSKSQLVTAAVLAIGAAALLLLDQTYHITGGHGRAVDALIARNVAARGGADAWRSVQTMHLEGQMDLGQEVHVPYTLEQKRSGKMCLEFEFDNEMATQCVNGTSGWKRLPFMGRNYAEPMNDQELNEMAAAVEIDGLLFGSDTRGYDVELIGHEVVDGRNTSKLEVTLPSGVVRWIYLDDESALEVKMEAMRTVRGKQRLVETFFSNWREVDGLLIPHRQESRMVGDASTHFVTVDTVTVNEPIIDDRFAMPMSARVAADPVNAS